MNITFVTGNKNKWIETRNIFSDNKNINILMESIDLSEIQGSIQEIAREKALKAAQIINGPVFIEDVALCFDAFGDTLPGPYIKWFIKDMGIHNVYKMLDGWPQKKTAKAICTIGYCHDPKMEPVMFQGVTEVLY